MKIIQHNNGVVVDIINARQDVTADCISVVDDSPPFEPREGFNGVLMYGENGLYWEYVEANESDIISDREALNIILGGGIDA